MIHFTKWRYGAVLLGNPVIIEIEFDGGFFIQMINDQYRIPKTEIDKGRDYLMELSTGEWFAIDKLPLWIINVIQARLLDKHNVNIEH